MFGIGTVSQTAINPNYVFTVDTSNTSSVDPSLTSYKFYTGNTSATTTGSILWEEVGNPSNNGTFNWDASVSTTNPVITFPSEGKYKISIPETINWGNPYHVAASIGKEKLIEVNNWGNHIFPSLYFAYYQCNNVKLKAQDAPILSRNYSLERVFNRTANQSEFEDISGSLSIWNTQYCNNTSYAFSNCYTMNTDISTWDMSNVTNTNYMFSYARAFNQPIDTQQVIANGRTYNAWDVSNVTSMNRMFGATSTLTGSFNQDLNNWDVRKVTNMTELFQGQNSFNGNITNWNPHSCSVFAKTFRYCNSFNQNLGSWDVGKATNTSEMFSQCFVFNQDITNWDVSNVTLLNSMFQNCRVFNQPIGEWDIQSATTLGLMMYNCFDFNQDISSWDTSNVTNLQQLFYGNNVSNMSFNNGNVPLTSSVVTKHGRTYTAWDTQNVTNFYLIFAQQKAQAKNHSFNQPIGNWDTSNATNLSALVQENPNFNQDISSSVVTVGSRTYTAWDVSKSTNFAYMFYNADAFNKPIGNWQLNTGSNVSLNSTFYSANAFNQDISSSVVTVGSNTYTAWDTQKVISFEGLFYNSPFIKDISNWNTVSGSSMKQMFRDTSFNQPINTNPVTVGSETYNAWDTKNVTNFQEMFYRNTAFNQSVLNWNTTSATILQRMFAGANGTNNTFNQPIKTNQVTVGGETYNAWDVSNVTNFNYLFEYNNSFNQPIGNWQFNTGSNVQSIYMFRSSPFNQDISSSVVTVGSNTYTAWDTQKVTSFAYMFLAATAFNKPIGNWNISNSTNLYQMFYGATSFNQDISASSQTIGSNTYIAWDTEKINNFSETFYNANAFNKPIRNWNTVSGSTFYRIFYGADNFNQNLTTQSISINGKNWDSWDVSNTTTSSAHYGANLKSMFGGGTSYDGTGLSSWNIESASFDNAFASSTTFSTTNYDALLISWAGQAPVWSGSINFGNSQYTYPGTATDARADLTNTYNWVITDGGY